VPAESSGKRGMVMIFHPSLKSLSEYAQSEAPGKHSRLDRHFAGCGKCRARFNALRTLGSALEPKNDISNDFTERLLEKLPTLDKDNRPVLAELKAVLGNALVFKSDDNEGTECFPDMLLRAGDYLKLNGSGKALIRLNDGSSIYLNKDTELSLETANRYNLKMYSGEIFAMMKPQRERFRIKTPSAELSVIGTEFNAGITNDNETVLKVKKGRVAFKNSSGETVAGRKQQVQASSDKKPAAAPLRDVRSISSWTEPVNPKKKGDNKNNMPKKIIGIILTLIIVIAGYVIYKHLSKSAQPEISQTHKAIEPSVMVNNLGRNIDTKQISFKFAMLDIDSLGMESFEISYPGFKNSLDSGGMVIMEFDNPQINAETISIIMKGEGLVEDPHVANITTSDNGAISVEVFTERPVIADEGPEDLEPVVNQEELGLKLDVTPNITDDGNLNLKTLSIYSYIKESSKSDGRKNVRGYMNKQTIEVSENQTVALKCWYNKKDDRYIIVLLSPHIL
jgi:FecR-like protein